MDTTEHTMKSGDYLLAVVGYAALRDVFREPDQFQRRMAEIRQVIAHDHEFPFNFDVTFSERAVVPGYTQWSETYDAPATNPALIIEEAIVHPILARLPRGRALDVACGTGRHACHLASLGHDVIGVDATPAMLELARAKAPHVDFREGHFDALPVDDGSIDVLTCALALCHERSVAAAVSEFARVLRGGGTAVVSDMHPLSTNTGGAAAFPSKDTTSVPFVRNHAHHAGEWFAAFRAAGIQVDGLDEGSGDAETAKLLPSYAAFPEATVRAFAGTPTIIVWTVTKPA
ncbi:MAG TPA: class I SAM-dependent methyltransferase [Acidimicrobiia bacterium]|jgi:ubiquinone/menaquinone biosynthesis C-methylase UbiE